MSHNVPCTYCLSEWGEPNAACFIAPQQSLEDKGCFIYRPVCASHAYGWYEGALFDEDEAPMYAMTSKEWSNG